MSESAVLNSYNEIVGMGNHEGKLLTVLYLDLNRVPQTESEMHAGFNEFIGSDAEWKPSRTIPYAYCAKSLHAYGQVDASLATDGNIEGYKISPSGITNSVPNAGLLGEWSISNPDLSLQLLGQTRTTGQTRAPQHRLTVLSRLVEADGLSLSVGEIADLESEDTKRSDFMNVYSACNALEASGLVNVERIIVNNETSYDILSYDIPEASRSELSDAVEGVYAFLDEAKKRGATTFSYKECLNFIADYYTSGGAPIDKAALRTRLSTALANPKLLPGIGRPERYKGNTKVTLNNKYEKAVRDLLDIIIGIEQGDASSAKKGRIYAQAIQFSPSLKTTLLNKAYLFSPAAKSQPAVTTKRQLVEILSGAGEPLSAAAVASIYESMHGRKLASHRVRSYLTELATADRVSLISQPVDNSRKRKHNLYFTPDKTSVV